MRRRRSAPSLEVLSDDVLGNILLYCPFPTAVRFAKGTSKNLRRRFDSSQWHPFWKTVYLRHGFCPPEERYYDQDAAASAGERSYLKLCKQKRQLLSNLVNSNSRVKKTVKKKESQRHKQQRHLFSLPNRFFHFLPLVPTPDRDDEDFSNTIAFYENDSFLLTGCGTSPELLLSDPFDGSLRVLRDCCCYCYCLQYNNTVASDEEKMERALKSDHGGIAIQHDGGGLQHPEEILENNDHHRRHEQPSPPITQCLLRGNECFDLNISEFFPDYRPTDSMSTEEFELNFVGMEAKPIWNVDDGGDSRNLRLEGYMVCVGRCGTSLHHDGLVCTELSTWTRSTSESTYGNRRLCRLPWAFHLVDMDPCRQLIFASFPSKSGPDESSKTISVFPLVDWQGGEGTGTYSPRRLLSFQCLHPVSTFILDATGQTLLATTTQGTLEIWKVSESSSSNITMVAHRQHSFGLLKTFRASIDRALTRRTTRHSDDGQNLKGGRDNRTNTGSGENGDGDGADDPRFDVSPRCTFLRRQLELAQFQAPVQGIFLPKHLPVEQAGFVTLHCSGDGGRSLLVWKLVEENTCDSWEVVSLIHLRLSSRRKPCISYDGNRIVVFGEDLIGPIILVYQVRLSLGGWEYDPDFLEDSLAFGDVYHLASPLPVVRFANRIRHVALGGFEAMDCLHMTCNERFLIVNTRTGNHLGTSPSTEGLLVIDLQDHPHHC